MERKLPSGVDRTGVRVNLTLPPDLDRVLQRVADAAGTGKASFVRELLLGMVPQLVQSAEALEAARAGRADALTMMSKTLRSSVNDAQQAQLELTKFRRIMSRKPRQ